MTALSHLKSTLTLVALVLALAIVGQARADVTAAPAPAPAPPVTVTGTGTGAQDVSGPQLTNASTPDAGTTATDPAPPDQVPAASASGDQTTTASAPTSADPTTVDPTTSTNQVIVQVQVSGCAANCQGTSQTQAAQQQNVTVQGAAPATAASQAIEGTSAPQPQSSAQVTQTQIGCVHDCSGTSPDTTVPAISPETLAELLGALGSQAPSGQPPDARDPQSSVQQTSLQWQQGAGSDGDQLQGASQQSATIQGAVSQAVMETVQSVNQATQTIVQVQIGCLFYCTDTHQTQQASQTSAAVQAVAQGVSAATAPAATVVSIVNQLIWQLQIGCLAWCTDATQEQSARQGAEVIVTTDPAASDDPSPADPGRAPGPGDPAGAQAPPPVTPPPPPVVTPPAPPVVTPAAPPAVTPQPPPGNAIAAPPVAVRTEPSSSRIRPLRPHTRVAGRQPASHELVGVSPAPSGAIGTRTAPVARHRVAPIRNHRGARISGQISTGSWRLQRSSANPATISLLPAGHGRGPNNGSSPVLAIVVALALGLLLLTTIRVRTR